MVSSDLFSDLKGGNPSFYFQQCTAVDLELNNSNQDKFDTIETQGMSTNDIIIRKPKTK